MTGVLVFVAGVGLAVLTAVAVGHMVWEAATKPNPYWRGWRSARVMTWRCAWIAVLGVVTAWPVLVYLAVPLALINGWWWSSWRRRGIERCP